MRNANKKICTQYFVGQLIVILSIILDLSQSFVSKNMFQKENKSFLNKLSCKDVSLTGLLNFVSVKYDASTTRFYHRFFPNNYLTITVNKL